MPFDSKAQAGFMFAHHPKIAERFAAETPDMKSLPEHVERMSEGGMVCRHCGGLVGEDGLAEMAAEMTTDPDDEAGRGDQAASAALLHGQAFADAVRQGRR